MTAVQFNPVTKNVVDGFLKNPSHAVMLVGPQGIGKGHVAQYITAQLLDIELHEVSVHPYVTIIEPDNNTIAVEQIRELQKKLTLKVPGQRSVRRVIVIEQAYAMGQEAQNALLKSLEEPPEDTVILLTTTDEKLLLPTIVSRAQILRLLLLDDNALRAITTDEKLITIAAGRPGLLTAMSQEADHTLTSGIETAKDFLAKTPYQRLITAQNMKERTECAVFLEALLLVAHGAMRHAAKANRPNTQVKSWQQRVKRIHLAQKQLNQNASIKLLMTDLCLSL